MKYTGRCQNAFNVQCYPGPGCEAHPPGYCAIRRGADHAAALKICSESVDPIVE